MNGRTIAEDMEREYQRQSLRDTFAAAALTGMLSRRPYNDHETHTVCEFAYLYADAMLRERGNHPAKPDSSTNTAGREGRT